MSERTPVVSVVMAAFNHERYVRAAAESILNQGFQDLELVAVNDGSTDHTGEVLGSLSDPRLRLIEQPQSGPSGALNRGILEARGRFVALMSGDDASLPHRIGTQLAAYPKRGSEVLFSHVQLIGDAGRPIAEPGWARGLFNVKPLGRAQSLRRLFDQGNFLSAVSMFTEKSVLMDISRDKAVGPHDPLLMQLQDFDLWIRLIKRHELRVLAEPLVQYRLREDGGNLSSPSSVRSRRTQIEHSLIARTFFDGIDDALFREAFGDRLVDAHFEGEAARRCEEARLLLGSSASYVRLRGIERAYELLGNPISAALFAGKYGVGRMKFMELLKEQPLFADPLAGFAATLFIDTGEGFVPGNSLSLAIDADAERFCLTYDLFGFPAVRALRWDPIEGLYCRLRLESVELARDDGGSRELDPARFKTNGLRGRGGELVFETRDPMVFLETGPKVHRIRKLTLRGAWRFADMMPRDWVAGSEAAQADLSARAAGALGGIARRVAQRLAKTLWPS